MKTFTPEHRQQLYRIVAAALPILAAYGAISDTQASLWVTLAAALLTSPVLMLAARHIPDADDYTGRHRAKDE